MGKSNGSQVEKRLAIHLMGRVCLTSKPLLLDKPTLAPLVGTCRCDRSSQLAYERLTMTKKRLPSCPDCRLKKLLARVAGTPVDIRKGTTLYHEHSGKRYVVRTVKVSQMRSNGVHYETHGYECVICGIWSNEVFKQIQLEALEELLRA